MFDLKITSKATFSFSKLNHELDKILPETIKNSNESIAEKWRENIKRGKFKALKPITQEFRKHAGYNPFYPGIKPKDTTTPLIATGKLLESIKATKDGVSFNKYGDLHVEGFYRPKRNWRTLKGLGEAWRILSKDSLKKFREDIKKAFRLKTPVRLRNMKF